MNINRKIQLLATATLALLLAACTAHDDGLTDNIPASGTPEVLRNVVLTLTPEVPLEIETRAPAYTDAIKSIYVFQIALESDENAGILWGRQVGGSPYYYEVANPTPGGAYNVTLPTLLKIKSKIFIIANNSTIYMEDAKKWTIYELEEAALSKSVIPPDQPADDNGYLWMTGTYEGTPTPRIEIPLKRTVAQVTFDLKTDLPAGHSFTLKTIQPKQVEVYMYFFSWPVQDNPYQVDYPTETTHPVTWLLPENQRGIGTGTTEMEKGGENAPSPYCTYIEVKGVYFIPDHWMEVQYVTYRIYLGNNNINDYNLCRNTKYTITTTIKGLNRADTRIIVSGNDAFNKGEYLDYTDNFAPWFAIHSTKYPENDFSVFMPGIDDPTATGADGSICPTGWRMPTTNELMLMYVYNGVVPPDPGYVGEVYLGSEKVFGNYSIWCQMWDAGGEISGRMEYSSTPRGILRCVRDF